MKKTLIAIIAVLLVVVLSLSLFACNKNKGKDNTEPEEQTEEVTGKQLQASELGANKTVTQQVLNYAEQYLTNNATDTKNVATAMAKALTNQFITKVKNGSIKSIAVNYVAGSNGVEDHYKIKITYSKTNDWYEYDGTTDLVARIAEAGEYAGYQDQGDAIDETKNDEELAKVYNAFLHTVKQAVTSGKAFGTSYEQAATGGANTGVKFGGSVEGLFKFNYGVGDGQIGPMSYGIKVYGTLGYTAADTEVAIEFIDELATPAKILGGLYYKNSTLYLALDFEYQVDKRNADGKIVDATGVVIEDANGKLLKDKVPAKETKRCQEKLMLDQAKLNDIFGSILGAAFSEPECVDLVSGETHESHAYTNGYCTYCGAKEPAAQVASTPFYEGADQTKLSTAISSMISGNSAGTIKTVIQIVLGLLKGTKSTLANGDTRYIYNLDIGSLLETVKVNFGDSIEEALSSMINDMGITFLEQFKLGSFKGVGGVLSLSFDVKGSGTTSLLAGAQIAYNAAQQDFRWSADDNVAKVYGPINAAITVKDFATGNDKVAINENAVLSTKAYEAFSPLNAEATANLTISGYSDDSYNGSYVVTARAAYNPFVLEDGEAEIILTKNGQAGEFLHVYLHNVAEGNNKFFHVTTYFDGKYYDTIADDSNLPDRLFEDFIQPLVKRDSTSDLAAISSYVWELIDQFSKPYTKADLDAYAAKAKSEISELKAQKAMTETVTENGTSVTKYVRRDGKIVYETITDSAWMKAIKDNAGARIDAIIAGVANDATEETLKDRKADIARILSQAKKDYKAQVEKEGKKDSFFEGFNIMTLATSITTLKDLFVNADNTPKNPSVLNYSFAADDPKAPFITANLDYTTYNAVIEVLRAAIPKIDDFDATAATVKVNMNDSDANKGKLLVDVKYPGNATSGFYEVKVALDSGNCLGSREATDADGNEYTEYYLKSTCTMSADVLVITPDKTYAYYAEIKISGDGWDNNGGIIDVSFKENDGVGNVTADQEFVNLHIVQKWATEAGKKVYRGFTVTATLRSRKADGSGMNEAHVYNITGEYDATTKMYDLILDTGNGNTITLGLGNFNGRLDRTNTLVFGIPTPIGGCTLHVAMGDEDVTFVVADAKIAKWGKGVSITGIDLANKEVIYQPALDDDWYDIITDLLHGFFYKEVA